MHSVQPPCTGWFASCHRSPVLCCSTQHTSHFRCVVRCHSTNPSSGDLSHIRTSSPSSEQVTSQTVPIGAGRRRRRTTASTQHNSQLRADSEAAAGEQQSSSSTPADDDGAVGPAQAPERLVGAAAHSRRKGAQAPSPVGVSETAAAAAVPAAASSLDSSSRKQPSSSKSSSTSSSISKSSRASSRNKQAVQEQQPANIEYALNRAVGSYTDPTTCAVYWEEEASNSSSNGNGASPGLRPDCESVKGLVYGATVRFSDSAALRLRRRAMVVWEEAGPLSVLIVKKPVPAAAATLRDMADWLHRHGLKVYVERGVQSSEFPDLEPFDPSTTQVDFAITLGGDGTVLHLASLFAEDTPLPPVMCFAMGTLGFLTPFDAGQFRSCLARVLAANRKPLFCTLRTRKRCVVVDADGTVLRVHHILNECVVDRGAFPSSVYLEVYIDGTFVTAAEADGLIIATPSGSTAYSMSAGGSIVAPSVPCTLITPLSPHSLSFRPLIVPENADLMIRLPENARSHARASFDGKHPMRIARGYSVHFTTSLCPMPLINIGSLDSDFFDGLTRKLKWNQSIRGVPAAVDGALLQQAAAAAAAVANGQQPAEVGTTQLTSQLSLGGLMSGLAAAAANEAKVTSWVEEALLPQETGRST